jgi:hypothetical protein
MQNIISGNNLTLMTDFANLISSFNDSKQSIIQNVKRLAKAIY